MNKCWASSISQCAFSKSGEHLFTKSILPDSIKVRGFPWCVEQYKEVSINSLTAHCLCKKHNEMLSELDSSALKCLNILKETNRVHNVRKALGKKKMTWVSLEIPGPTFERWCFKTAFNLFSLDKHWEPDEPTVKVIYGNDVFVGNKGIGMCFDIVGINKMYDDQNILHFAPMYYPDRGLVGFIIGFYGLMFFGSWVIDITQDTFMPKQVFEDGKRREIMHHLKIVRFEDSMTQLKFKWPEK